MGILWLYEYFYILFENVCLRLFDFNELSFFLRFFDYSCVVYDVSFV